MLQKILTFQQQLERSPYLIISIILFRSVSKFLNTSVKIIYAFRVYNKILNVSEKFFSCSIY